MRLRDGSFGWGARSDGEGAVGARVATGPVRFERTVSDHRPTRTRKVHRLGRVGLALLAVLLGTSSLTALADSDAAAAAASLSTAYVTNEDSKSVTPIELATNTPGKEITVGTFPRGIAITPDGNTAYVTNEGSKSVTPIDVASNEAGPEITVGSLPAGIAITPDGKTAYVTNEGSESVTPIELATNKPGPEITVGTVGSDPFGIAITPDGKTVYVTNLSHDSVTPIEVATNKAGPEITVGASPYEIAITPDGKTAYVTNEGSNSVTPIELASNKAGTQIPVGSGPIGIAITPDGKTADVTNENSKSVTPIELASNKASPEITVGSNPQGVAIAPDGKTAYVTNGGSNSVTPIELASNKAGQEITVGSNPLAIAITPPAPPVVVTEAASAITQSTATLNALVNPNGWLIGECRFEYGTSAAYGSTVACLPAPGFGPAPAAVSTAITGLSANSEYHFRSSATNLGGSGTGSDRSFRTLALPATIASAQAPPAITAASLTNRRFRVARTSTAISAKKAPIGTAFHFTLSAGATVKIKITRTAPGLRHGSSCLAPSNKLKRAHAKRCTRTLTLGTLTRASEPVGADSLAFSGRIGRSALSPGAYTALLSASNADGSSKPVTLGFTIVRG